jgi:hypothetical protein
MIDGCHVADMGLSTWDGLGSTFLLKELVQLARAGLGWLLGTPLLDSVSVVVDRVLGMWEAKANYAARSIELARAEMNFMSPKRPLSPVHRFRTPTQPPDPSAATAPPTQSRAQWSAAARRSSCARSHAT